MQFHDNHTLKSKFHQKDALFSQKCNMPNALKQPWANYIQKQNADLVVNYGISNTIVLEIP